MDLYSDPWRDYFSSRAKRVRENVAWVGERKQRISLDHYTEQNKREDEAFYEECKAVGNEGISELSTAR